MEKTVGQQLKQAREELGIRLEDAAQATHIKLAYLQELENDHPELLPSTASARGFLRLYASYLKLSPAALLELWDHPVPPPPVSPPGSEPPAVLPQVEGQAPQVGAPPEAGTPAPSEPSKAVESAEFLSPLAELQSPPVFGKKKSLRKKKGKPTSPETAPESGTPQAPAEPVEQAKPAAESLPKEEEVIAPPATESPQPASLPQKSSTELFLEIGSQLRSRRELLGLSLSDVERFTHIKRNFLEALENGQFNLLPSSVQGRGMLNNYAAFLSLDGDALMGTYAAALETQRLERLPPTKPEPILTGGIRINIPPQYKKYLNPDLIFGSLVILAMFVFLLWSAVRIFSGKNPALTPTAPSISEVLQTTPSASPLPDLTLTAQGSASLTVTPVPGVGLPAAPAVPTPLVTKDTAPIQIYIVALQRAYLQVTVDDRVVFDGRVIPGGAYTFSGQKKVELLTGSAAALEVYFNQKFQGRLGEVGQVMRLTFTESGLATPEPTRTPLATASPTPTLTPTVSSTPR